MHRDPWMTPSGGDPGSPGAAGAGGFHATGCRARNSGCREGSAEAEGIPSRTRMAATERHIRRRTEAETPRQRVVGDPVPGAVIDFRSVSKKYPSGDMGLEDATFAIHPGEFVFLVGSTG